MTTDELREHFGKVGMLEISPYDQQPKIKIYKDQHFPTECKGDGSLCYASSESVKVAIDILDGGYIRPGNKITVARAEFDKIIPSSNKGPTAISKPKLTQAQVKVARAATKQALAWNEDDDIGVSNKSALKIVVLEGMFDPQDFDDVAFEGELEKDVGEELESKCGQIDKMTVFSKNVNGILIVKFCTSYAAQECIKLMNGRFFGGKKIRSYFWDGLTNYTMTASYMEAAEKQEEEDMKRVDDFGDWYIHK